MTHSPARLPWYPSRERMPEMQTPSHERQEVAVPLYVVVLAVLLFLILIGLLNSQPNQDGRPLLLLPDVWRTVGYQHKATAWGVEFQRVETDLNGLLSDNQVGDLLSQSQAAQRTLERAAGLAREIDQTPVPVAVSGLREMLSATALNYLEASRLALRWLNTPTKNAYQEAMTKLGAAHESAQALEESEWIKTR